MDINITSSLLDYNVTEITDINEIAKECWICKEDINLYVRFCECGGNISYVHRKCLNTWINTSHKTKCDFCRTEYKYDHELNMKKYVTKLLFPLFVLGVIITACILTFIKNSLLYSDSLLVWGIAGIIILYGINYFIILKDKLYQECVSLSLTPYETI